MRSYQMRLLDRPGAVSVTLAARFGRCELLGLKVCMLLVDSIYVVATLVDGSNGYQYRTVDPATLGRKSGQRVADFLRMRGNEDRAETVLVATTPPKPEWLEKALGRRKKGVRARERREEKAAQERARHAADKMAVKVALDRQKRGLEEKFRRQIQNQRLEDARRAGAAAPEDVERKREEKDPLLALMKERGWLK